MMNNDFVFVYEYASGIYWDAEYATWGNFAGKPVDAHLANGIAGTRPRCAASWHHTPKHEPYPDTHFDLPIVSADALHRI